MCQCVSAKSTTDRLTNNADVWSRDSPWGHLEGQTWAEQTSWCVQRWTAPDIEGNACIQPAEQTTPSLVKWCDWVTIALLQRIKQLSYVASLQIFYIRAIGWLHLLAEPKTRLSRRWAKKWSWIFRLVSATAQSGPNVAETTSLFG